MDSAGTRTDVFIHSGVVTGLEEERVTVTLDRNLHCETCSAKGACGISDAVDRTIEINTSGALFYKDEPVEVVLQKHMGYKAVIWAYVLPFCLMLITLVGASFFLSEWLAGLLSILILVPYYILLYSLKPYFRETFKISIQSN